MLFSLGHGGQIATDLKSTPGQESASATSAVKKGLEKLVPADAVVDGNPETALRGAEATAPALVGAEAVSDKGAFRYYFKAAPEFPVSPLTLAALDALATSMVESGPQPPFASLPPILTYFGQFIDHDITAKTDREVAGLSIIDGTFTPAARATVETDLDNLRDGSLGLDSLYGDSPNQGDFATKLAGLMRHPTLKAKMRLGVPSTSPGGPPALPVDKATDLLRLGFLIDKGDITLAELNALDAGIKANFMDAVGPIRSRAIIGDGRNDENLVVAQLQVAFLRFHNRLVDEVKTFPEARRLTRYHYQWFVAHDYLPSVCDRSVVDELLAKGSPLYTAFFQQNAPSVPDKMPLPLEFSVAGFRFGHSMVREAYDHNNVFGTPEPGKEGINLIPGAAPFNLFFTFTGSGRMNPTPNPTNNKDKLPDNWVIDWKRFVNAETPLHSARAIDTHLAPPLDNLSNEPPGVFKKLAMRNLRRGYRLNLPSAQSCIAAINATGLFRQITPLTSDEIMDGRDIPQADLGADTPIWFYILREAERLGGAHLGPLGSHIVAGTLLGLIVNDPSSYWNDATSGHRWSPSTFRPAEPIDSLKAMLRFTGQL
jgi:Animal haem peroxidase